MLNNIYLATEHHIHRTHKWPALLIVLLMYCKFSEGKSSEHQTRKPCSLGLRTSKTKCEVCIYTLPIVYVSKCKNIWKGCEDPYLQNHKKFVELIVQQTNSSNSYFFVLLCFVFLYFVFVIKQMMHSCYTLQFKLHKSTSLPWQLEAHG